MEFKTSPVRCSGWRFTAKEGIDRTVALLLLVLLAPLLLVIVLALRATSSEPVIFRQRRVGRDGRKFEILKFRTMRGTSADDHVAIPFDLAPGGMEGAGRRTWVGKWLRATSLDELPQFLNVVRGEMSLIGPRPERPEYVERFTARVPRYSERHRMKSGITGWAQAHGSRGQTPIAERVQLDNYYIDNWSFRLEAKTVVLTAVELLRFRDGKTASKDRMSERAETAREPQVEVAVPSLA